MHRLQCCDGALKKCRRRGVELQARIRLQVMRQAAEGTSIKDIR